MRNILKEVVVLIYYAMIMLGLLIKQSILILMTAHIMKRMEILLLYVGIVAAFVVARPVFWIFMGFLGCTVMILAVIFREKERKLKNL